MIPRKVRTLFSDRTLSNGVFRLKRLIMESSETIKSETSWKEKLDAFDQVQVVNTVCQEIKIESSLSYFGSHWRIFVMSFSDVMMEKLTRPASFLVPSVPCYIISSRVTLRLDL